MVVRRGNAGRGLAHAVAVFCILMVCVDAIVEEDIYEPLPPAQSLHGPYCRVCFTLIDNFGSIFKEEKRLFSKDDISEILVDFVDSAMEITPEERMQSTALSLGPMPPTVADQKLVVRHLIEARRDNIIEFLTKPPVVVKTKTGERRQSTDFKKWDVRFCGEAIPVCKHFIDKIAEQARSAEEQKSNAAREKAEAEKQAATGKKKQAATGKKKKKKAKSGKKKKKAKKAAAAPAEDGQSDLAISDAKNEL